VLAALVDIPPNVGYSVVFALIAVETMGIPVPGETALIAAALLAHDGKMDIVPLIVVAAAAAIIGDNVGFAIGRKGGRRLFEMPGPFYRQRIEALAVGEPFFAKHGPKAVFLGRWVAGLRIASAWLAGMNKMSWPRFLFWNALGGICWATSIGLGIYVLGHAFEDVIGVGGIVAAGLVSGLVVGIFVWKRMRGRRVT
jgi:membrane protein DedA with SNARE-associated domain